MTVWMIRAGQHGEGENDALNGHFVGIGWPELGDLTQVGSGTNIRLRLDTAYPDAKPSALASWSDQVEAFRFQIQTGDLVALPLKSAPAVAFGRVTGEYRYAPGAVETIRHQRPVEWLTDGIPRDLIDQDFLSSLGAGLTVGRINRNDAELRVEGLLSGESPPEPDDVAPTTINVGEVGRDQIRRRVAGQFPGHELARLIGELLTAEGYTCSVSPPWPGGSGDILAGPGRLGFGGADLAVLVKPGSAPADPSALHELKDTMANVGVGHGLLISWGGFTKTTRQEARRLFFEIRLWDSDTVIDQLLAHYDQLPPRLRARIPLQQVWALLPDDD